MSPHISQPGLICRHISTANEMSQILYRHTLDSSLIEEQERAKNKFAVNVKHRTIH